jgi:thioredoxin 1
MSKFKDIVDGETPVLVSFFAEWCESCKMVSPILQEVKAELKEDIRIIKIDVDKNLTIAKTFQIRGVPTMMLFKKGDILWRESGVIPTPQLKQKVTELI